MGLFDDLKDLKNVLVDVTGLDPFPEGKKSPLDLRGELDHGCGNARI